MFPDFLRERVEAAGVFAVLQVEDVSAAVPLARALIAGGVYVMELTLRTSAAMDAIERIRAEVPEMTVGVGTILTPQQVRDAQTAGAAFGVAPGMNPRVVEEAKRIGLPFAPGVCTPTEMELAVEQGCRLLKFFPAAASGGLEYLRSAAAPLAHLGVRFLPLGGIDAGNLADYLRERSVLAVGGSWLAPPPSIRQQDWAGITAKAEQASALVAGVRGAAE